MAKVQIAIRIDQDLLDAFDKLAKDTGESRTEVIIAAAERGLHEEQKFVAGENLPVVREIVEAIEKSGLAGRVARLLGSELDPRRIKIAEQIRAKRRQRPPSGRVKGAES